jgi:hypothetical protein
LLLDYRYPRASGPWRLRMYADSLWRQGACRRVLAGAADGRERSSNNCTSGGVNGWEREKPGTLPQNARLLRAGSTEQRPGTTAVQLAPGEGSHARG